MIVRNPAKYIILFVSIFLLAHAVIPHIHFNNKIILVGTQNHNNQEECRHNHHNHTNKNGGNDDFCLLKQFYLIRLDDTKETIPEFTKRIISQNKFHDLYIDCLNSTNYNFIPEISSPPFNETFLLYSFGDCGNINKRGSPMV